MASYKTSVINKKPVPRTERVSQMYVGWITRDYGKLEPIQGAQSTCFSSYL